ncbi:hypothetical protein LCGC14_3027930 [marine sediment metagenome]|uniref:Uncharacterized protein n=1 Tax=marine sediment metagenome TaxID=412755 RepID=A0A0F8XGF9_9ZZZZ
MSEYKPDYDPVIDADISILSVAFNDYDAYCESTEASAVFNWLYDYALNADKRIKELEAKEQYAIAAHDKEFRLRRIAEGRIAALESLLRTTVDLLSDTDSLVLEQLTIDIACILPEK